MTARKAEKPSVLVSVMVPAYNAADTILETLDCVAAQTYRPIELIVVNDGSTDDTGAIVRGWIAANEGEGLTAVCHDQPNGGLMAARNKGVDLASGAYFQFLDADDLIHPKKIEICMDDLLGQACDVAVPGTRKFKARSELDAVWGGAPLDHHWDPRAVAGSTIMTNWWHSVGPVVDRRVVEAIGPARTDINPFVEELEFHGRIKLAGAKVCYIDKELNFYRTAGEGRLTGGIAKTLKGRIDAAWIAVDLLTGRGVSSRREWDALEMHVFQTYWQAMGLSDDPSLVSRAREAGRHVIAHSPGAAGWRWTPLYSGALFPLIRIASRARMRRLGAGRGDGGA